MFFSKEASFLYFVYSSYEFILAMLVIIDNHDRFIASTMVAMTDYPFLLSLYGTDDPSQIEINIYDIFNNQTIEKSFIYLPENITVSSIENIDITSYIDDSSDGFKIVIVYSKNVLPQNVFGLFGIVLEISDNFEITLNISSKSPFDFGNYPSVKLSKLFGKDLMILEVLTNLNYNFCLGKFYFFNQNKSRKTNRNKKS